jgi:hypothetical protein
MKSRSALAGVPMCILAPVHIVLASVVPPEADWPDFTDQQVPYSGSYSDVLTLASSCTKGPTDPATGYVPVTDCAVTANGAAQFVDPNTGITWEASFTGTPVTLYTVAPGETGYWWGDGYYGSSGGSFRLSGPNGWLYSGIMLNGAEAVQSGSGDVLFGINFQGTWGSGAPLPFGYFYFVETPSGDVYLDDFVLDAPTGNPTAAPEPTTTVLVAVGTLVLGLFAGLHRPDSMRAAILRSRTSALIDH